MLLCKEKNSFRDVKQKFTALASFGYRKWAAMAFSAVLVDFFGECFRLELEIRTDKKQEKEKSWAGD